MIHDDEGADLADVAVAMEVGRAAAEAEQAAEEAEEAEEAAEAAEEIAEAALDTAVAALEVAASDSDHGHPEYVTREEVRALADAYVLELAALGGGETESEPEEEPEEDVPPPSIEKPKKKSFAERWDNT